MTLGVILFWVIMALWLIGGLGWTWRTASGAAPFANNFVPWVLFLLLGLKVFGFAL